jgi:type 1 glutamine amidotransferase
VTGQISPTRERIDGHLVVGGTGHDFDAVRLDLLALAARDPRLRLRCSSGYEEFGDGAAVRPPAFLLSYSCNLAPSPAALGRLRAFLEGGGRWLALHATNSLLDWRADGVAAQGLEHPFLALVGSAFQAHPPYGPVTVRPVGAHPMVAGIAPFEVEDELYLSDMADDVTVLLATRFAGEAPGFVRRDWRQGDPVRPLMHLRAVGAGAVLHLGLGHRRGHYDAPHRAAFLPRTEPGPWGHPSFRLLLERGLHWAARTDPGLEQAVEEPAA